MKKFVCLATIGAFFWGIITSCHKNEIDDKVEEGIDTYATFTINPNAPGSKAIYDFNPLVVLEDDAANSKIAAGDIYMLVFNKDNVLEYKAEVQGTTHTALLKSGLKSVFVLANLGTLDSHVMGNLKYVNPITLNPDEAISVTYHDFVVGVTTLDDLYSTAFDAGTPQPYDVDKSGPRTFNLSPLATPIDANHGLPMSNNNQYTFSLKANVSKTQAETPISTLTHVLEGIEMFNRFAIHLPLN